MEKKHEELSKLYNELNNKVKDAICDHMKELGHIKFNTRRDFPFVDSEGEFVSVIVEELEYNEELFGDVAVIDDEGVCWSVQEECTVDGCMELLYYIEAEAYVKL